MTKIAKKNMAHKTKVQKAASKLGPDHWFNRMTPATKKAYLEAHPNSIFAHHAKAARRTEKEAAKKADSNSADGLRKRIKARFDAAALYKERGETARANMYRKMGEKLKARLAAKLGE
jgi:hypothetical protein